MQLNISARSHFLQNHLLFLSQRVTEAPCSKSIKRAQRNKTVIFFVFVHICVCLGVTLCVCVPLNIRAKLRVAFAVVYKFSPSVVSSLVWPRGHVLTLNRFYVTNNYSQPARTIKQTTTTLKK